MKKSRKKTSTILIWDVPTPLKVQFKKACAKEGMTMKRVMMDLMQNYCEIQSYYAGTKENGPRPIVPFGKTIRPIPMSTESSKKLIAATIAPLPKTIFLNETHETHTPKRKR